MLGNRDAVRVPDHPEGFSGVNAGYLNFSASETRVFMKLTLCAGVLSSWSRFRLDPKGTLVVLKGHFKANSKL